MTDRPRGAACTKDRAGAAFAWAVVYFAVQSMALDWTKQAVPDYAYTAACLVAAGPAFLVAFAVQWTMKRRP
ncbi:hypothetical protein [Streptacidiphilus rugosus]|uniref:hypothetical protein n=1 Tax=Streptacidiphilus rugosus TaxID=405783 RepID=UPI0012F7A47A|nr:hypothetical protein [Streptacidiphilus rugosus]